MEHALLSAWLGAGVLLTFAHSLVGSAFPLFSAISLGSQEVQRVLVLGLPFTIGIMVAGLLITLRVGVSRKTHVIQTQLSEQIALRERAEAANAAKAEFLASMSREIEAPMNAIFNFTDMALKTELKADSRECLDTIRTSAEWLMQIMNDVLEFSRIEAGRLQLHSARFSFAECIRSTLKIAEPKAVAKGLTVRSKIDPRIPASLCGDFTRFRQVILNLVDNAVKFTTSGGVMLSAMLESESPEAVLVRIAVADTGIGIPVEKQQFIFEPFRPADAGADRTPGGTGLGLAISRRLVKLMGGKVEFQSQLGAGTTFEFTAWFQKQQNAAEADVTVLAPAPTPNQSSPVQVGTVQKSDSATSEHPEQKDCITDTVELVKSEINANSAKAAGSAGTNSSESGDAVEHGVPAVATLISDVKTALEALGETALPEYVVEEAPTPTGILPSAANATVSTAEAVNGAAIDTPAIQPHDIPVEAAESFDADSLAAFLQNAGIWKAEAITSAVPSVAADHNGSPDSNGPFVGDQVHELRSIDLEIAGERCLEDSNSGAADLANESAIRINAFAEIENSPGTSSERTSDGGQLSVPAALVLLTSACQDANEPVAGKPDESPALLSAWDPFEQARTWLSKSRFDIRVIHSDGDPSDRNLI